MTYPNFFIVGAPKCGTTALSRYLGEHEQVLMSQPKEPCFFVEVPRLRRVTTLKEYLSLFWAAEARHVAVGEASVWYLYLSEALTKIRAFNSSARIIVMVRNPVELAQAMHAQSVRAGVEDEVNFERAWRLQRARAAGRSVPSSCADKRLLLYAEIAKLGLQLTRVLDVFDRRQVHVVLFDDLAQRPRQVYEDALRFLGALPDDRSVFPRINPNSRVRSRRLAPVLRAVDHRWDRVARCGKRLFRIRRELGIRRRVLNLNRTIAERPALAPALHAELVETFREDVGRLSALLGQDLTRWLDDAAGRRSPVSS